MDVKEVASPVEQKPNADQAERNRIAALSNRALERELRQTMRKKPENLLLQCYGVALISIFNDRGFAGEDAYREFLPKKRAGRKV